MNDTITFRERVLDFWQWFPTIADKVAESLQSGNGLDGLDFDFTAEVRERVGGLSWVFGPGESDDRLSFTVTGEGQRARQLLSHYWLSLAVEVPKWDFYCSRQPSPPEHLALLAIDVGGNSVDAETLMIAPEIVEKDQVVNIKAWHESFENIPDEARFQILYLLLDEALGEYATQTKLGDMQFNSDLDAIPLSEFPKFLEDLWKEKDWEISSPLETYSGYGAEPSSGFDRADTIAGFTCVPNLVLSFLNQSGKLAEDPIENSGAQHVFVQIKMEIENLDDPLAFRNDLENKISEQIDGSGYVTGGATGTHNLYIDLVIFDGDHSKALVNKALEDLEEPYEIKPFI